MTTKQDALKKVRKQITFAEDYVRDNPDWQGAKEVLRQLREREHVLANECQVEMARTELSEMLSA